MSVGMTATNWRASRLAGGALVIALLVLLASPPRAAADNYTLPEMVSRPSALEQPNGPVQQIAMSSNGRYILYYDGASNLQDTFPSDWPSTSFGLYRYDTQTGQSELAAWGGNADNYSSSGFAYSGPTASISANGQYVIFESGQLLPSDPQLGYGEERLYIRNMELPVDQASSYTEPLGNTSAELLGPHSFSNDGSTFIWAAYNGTLGVAYWTDTTTGQTLPISVAYDPTTGTMNPNQPETDVTSGNVVLSGDGTTVAWGSNQVWNETPTAPGETTSTGPSGQGGNDAGVLWRDMADGPRAVTRRVTTDADIENPNCTSATPVTVDPTPPGPCDNAQLDTASGSVVGGISDDGTKVAVIADGHPRGSGIPQGGEAYVVTMLPGVDPVDTMVTLTQGLPGQNGPAVPDSNFPINGIAMSGNGRYVAFTTQRVLFPLNPPTPVGRFPGSLNCSVSDPQITNAYECVSQLYLVDLQDMQLQMLSQTPSGGLQDAGPSVSGYFPGVSQPPLVSEDGSTIAFMSTADNLVSGDANGFNDAFMVQQLPAEANTNQTGPQIEQLPPTGADLSPEPDWSLLVDSTSSEQNGDVQMTAETPAAGVLRATVEDHGVQLAGTSVTAGGAGPVTLTLTPQVTDAQGNTAMRRTRNDSAVLTFTPAPGANGPITDSVPVSFHLPAEKVGVGTHAVAKPRALRLKLTLPAAGRVMLSATRRARQGQRVITATVAKASKRAGRAGTVVITLAPRGASAHKLPTGRVPLKLNVRFTPAKAGIVPPLARTVAATLPRTQRKSLKTSTSEGRR